MSSEKQKVAAVSMLASGSLAIIKLTVGLAIGSLALISDALHSVIDFCATCATWIVVRFSDRPADSEHHYGHGKIESLSALGLTALLYVLAGGIVVEAISRLREGVTPGAITALPFVIMIVEIGVNFWRARALHKTAMETKSHALEADALHFATDMYGSFAVIAGLGMTALGYQWGDAAAAILVAIIICLLGLKLGRNTIESLLDRAPEGAAEQAGAALKTIPGIIDVERLRVRNVGLKHFVDAVVHVPRTLPLDRMEAIKRNAEQALGKTLGDTDLTFTAVPIAQDSESVRDRIMVIARNRALAVHHVTVHDLGSHLTMGIDLEVEGQMSLMQAHDITLGLEAAIRDEFGPATEVDTHIEPLQPDSLHGVDAPDADAKAISEALIKLAATNSAIRDIHDVRVRSAEDGYVVNFHCRTEPERTVIEVHDLVDEIERGIRRQFTSVKRVISHAEPLRGNAPNSGPEAG